jgi:hypothetical protein
MIEIQTKDFENNRNSKINQLDIYTSGHYSSNMLELKKFFTVNNEYNSRISSLIEKENNYRQENSIEVKFYNKN